MKQHSKNIRLEKLTHWNIKQTWSRWFHPGLRSYSRVSKTKRSSPEPLEWKH